MANKKTGCGAKISVSMTEGLVFVDPVDWDAFNKNEDQRPETTD